MDKQKTGKIDAKDFQKRRLALNISQKDFANACEVSYRTIIRLEQGKTISKKVMHKIVHSLKTFESKPQDETLWWKSHKK
jgi:predicted transcriptional regulator